MKKLTKLEKFGLVAAIIIAGTYFYMGKIYDPQANALKKTVIKLNKIIGEINSIKEVSSVGSINRTIKKGKEELEKIKSELKNSTVKTGKESEITELLSMINRLVDQNHLVVKSIVPKGKVAGALFAWSSFDLDMEGSFYFFLEFLTALKKMPDSVKIQNMNIEKNGNIGDVLKINMTLMI
ncbi:MAG: type 4a pilus biogenesis protein PilO [Desulfobacteraceae bacterium]|nr:type 4a pilus biogenesis protein PilO [Desulfobacteraceae bacterium]MBC2718910.1 type 4a pilus biogenesis protein PilO [Desulfobacteraceae bacterium]